MNSRFAIKSVPASLAEAMVQSQIVPQKLKARRTKKANIPSNKVLVKPING